MKLRKTCVLVLMTAAVASLIAACGEREQNPSAHVQDQFKYPAISPPPRTARSNQ